MKHLLFGGAAALLLAALALYPMGKEQTRSDQPQYTHGNALVRPQSYRQWIYLSSGLGMEYTASRGAPEMFTNVFVAPSAYHQFVTSGRWPDKTLFVLEERTAASKGSINKSGHYQTDLAGLAASVKDQKRFPEKWAYFAFSTGEKSSPAKPRNACWQCHNSHAAVDNTFVQFYPTLKKVAQKLGTYDEAKAAGQTGQQ